MSLKHFVRWDTTPKELRNLAENLQETPTIAIEIAEDVELLIKNKEFKLKQGVKAIIEGEKLGRRVRRI